MPRRRAYILSSPQSITTIQLSMLKPHAIPKDGDRLISTVECAFDGADTKGIGVFVTSTRIELASGQ